MEKTLNRQKRVLEGTGDVQQARPRPSRNRSASTSGEPDHHSHPLSRVESPRPQGHHILSDIVAQHEQTLQYLQGLLAQSRDNVSQSAGPEHFSTAKAATTESPSSISGATRASRGARARMNASEVSKAKGVKRTTARAGSSRCAASAASPQSSLQRLNDTFRQLETSMALEDLTGPDDDDHLLICAITMGWDAVTSKHSLDTVWQFLRMFDKHIYSSMERIGRLAALRALRALLIHKIRPINQATRAIPPFLHPTVTQQAKEHPAIIDYFAWPSVRDHHITNSPNICRTPPSSHTKFAMNFTFNWPYLFSDVYMTLASSGRHVFTKEFDERFNDLSCWQIACYDDTSLIPAHLQFDNSLLTHYERLELNRETTETIGAISRDNWTQGLGGDSPIIWSPSNFSFDQRSDIIDSGHDMVQSSQLQSEGPTAFTESHIPVADDWAWAFDTARPEYGSLQSLLELMTG